MNVLNQIPGRLFLCPLLLLLMTMLVPEALNAYPLDGFAQTGIRRLNRLELIKARTLKGPALSPGACLTAEAIYLHPEALAVNLADTAPLMDAKLQQQVDALFPDRDESYSLALLDISPGRPVRLALRQSTRRFAVGSVGKLAVAAGLFNELQRLFPDDIEKRQALLKNTMVTAGPWIETDHHEIPIFEPGTHSFSSRPARQGDVFSLYEWADHMISASANAAASTLWKELILMRHFNHAYPPSRQAEDTFFSTFPKKELSALAATVVNEPLLKLNISREEFHLGNFFTRQGKKMIPGEGDSMASPLGLLKYLLAMEQGRIVDPWSSLEIKRLMYTTARRIRYGSSPALAGAALYFKSGSLYRCGPEPGFTCKKYMGNLDNFMNSVVIVEHPDNRIYMVALMSNVLKKNSAVDHQTLATQIEALMKLSLQP
ncbi:MAG: serine hydrolase [Proteobacteria bacterium]|nr:serine hydrolase [Pseudomonadota bacterium]